MCPINVHWHIKLSYTHYWRVKVTVTNLNYAKNYTDWNLVALHPNLKSIQRVFSFNYKPLDVYGNTSKIIALNYWILIYVCMYLCFEIVGNLFLIFFFFYFLQMTVGCFMGFNTTMMCFCRQGRMGMFRQKYCWTKMKGSHSRKGGDFLGRFPSTVRIVWCHHLMIIQGSQMLLIFMHTHPLSLLWSCCF